ncbi:MAG: DUF5615 family PIN-like protein [Candidatus Margulisbacteria bacterium]|nr:DUF5615 family PIN-like protein [Candidatus Margulisiibacteriota bacterium]
MLAFLIDEDLPRSTARELIKAGYRAFDVRDVGLRGKGDNEIFSYCQANKMVLISADLDFANIIRFPINSHGGIIVLRFPNEISNDMANKELLASLNNLKEAEICGRLIIVEPGKTRLHKYA